LAFLAGKIVPATQKIRIFGLWLVGKTEENWPKLRAFWADIGQFGLFYLFLLSWRGGLKQHELIGLGEALTLATPKRTDLAVLFVGKAQHIDFAALGQGQLNFVEQTQIMRFAAADAHINRQLRHFKALIKQRQAKGLRVFAFGFGQRGQIKHHQ
jgi:hypothetical protein